MRCCVMFKKYKYIWLVLALSTAVAVVTTNHFSKYVYSKISAVANRKVVIIDAGHGGFDPGARYCDLSEKDINLQISGCLADIFSLNGYQVVMTRQTDVSTDTVGETTAEKKRSDLENRLAIMKQYPSSVFLSIHQNAFSGKSSGSQIFYRYNSIPSAQLAKEIQDSITSNLQKDNKRQHKATKNDYYLIRNAPVPAVLIECGFLSDAKEAKLLLDKEYQQQLCLCIFNGVSRYLNVI